jgi:hypothetical protein
MTSFSQNVSFNLTPIAGAVLNCGGNVIVADGGILVFTDATNTH